jgi:lysyl-tRNA synthetase class 2
MSTDAEWGAGGGVAMLERRDALRRVTRGFFEARRFVEVDTPVVVRSAGPELHLDALEVHGLGATRYLHTSPEYHMKRLLAAGAERIYQLGWAHRRGELGTLHEPAFTMLEWYRTGVGSEALMADTEALVVEAARALCGGTSVSTAFGELDVAPPWERLSVAEAFERHASVDVRTLLGDEERYYRTLIERVEPNLGRGRPTLLTRYPASMASLAKLNDDDPSTADRFEAYACGVELCNGFGELTDAAEQRRRFELELSARARAGRECPPIDERFLAALQDGLPPCAGNALGFDRLLMLLVGASGIAEVMAFPLERA